MGRASEFFGEVFNSPPPPPPQGAPQETKPTSLVGRAESFFGQLFSYTPKAPNPAPAKRVEAPAPAAAPTASMYPSEGAMAQAVKFSPQEDAARSAEMKSPAFLNGLKEELARAKDSKTISILKEEIAKFHNRK